MARYGNEGSTNIGPFRFWEGITRMNLYKEIQQRVKTNSGLAVQTCWIAHVLELNGHPPRRAHNRTDPNVRQKPCPPDKRPLIERELRFFGRI
jgi:hypothetical protein